MTSRPVVPNMNGDDVLQNAAPRHVAFLVNHFPIASEIFIMNAAAALGRRGVALDIIGASGITELSGNGSGDKDNNPQQDIEREIADNPLIAIRGPLHPYHRRNRWSAIPRMIAELTARRGIGTTMRVLRIAKTRGGTRFLAQAHALSAQQYDAVHCQFGTLGPLALDLREAGVIDAPIVVHFRGYDISRHVLENGDDVYDRVFRDADWFIANCTAFRNRCVKLGCDPAKIDIVSSGADLSQFPFGEREPAIDGTIRLLAIGRLVAKKGFATAIEAVQLVRESGVRVHLNIVGDGPLRNDFNALIARHDLARTITFAGALPHSAIAERLAASDILLAPSETAPDGDSDAPVNTLKEAMATGAPVIGSRHGGIPEIIDHGKNGLLFDEGDAEGLAACIRKLASDPELRAAMGREGRKTVERSHSLDLATDQYLAVYDRIARDKRGAVTEGRGIAE
ncbi:MAG: glycosyltransferase [Pontixanthobacter sp.]